MYGVNFTNGNTSLHRLVAFMNLANAKRDNIMTQEKAKTLLPLIQAFAEGIPMQRLIMGEWCDITSGAIDWENSTIRIKPRMAYRPFVTIEECWQEMLRHQPIGWLKDKDTKNYDLILSVEKEGIRMAAIEDVYDFAAVMKFHTFPDGTPFGVLYAEEENLQTDKNANENGTANR